MTARIKGFVTRAEAGLRKPRSVSRNITPQNGGVAKHYWGAGGHPKNHVDCIKKWREGQKYHMDGHGWVDIAYTGGYCDHGYAFAGRGFGIRTAANGTNAGNQNFYAFVYLGGASSKPTREALDVLDWWTAEARRVGKAGKLIRNHCDFKSTGCPGAFLKVYSPTPTYPTAPKTVTPKPVKVYVPGPRHKFPLPHGYYFGPASGPAKSVSGKHKRIFKGYYDQWWIREWARQLSRRGWSVGKGKHYLTKYGNDGIWGAEYEKLVIAFQKSQRLSLTGRLDERTWNSAFHSPIT